MRVLFRCSVQIYCLVDFPRIQEVEHLVKVLNCELLSPAALPLQLILTKFVYLLEHFERLLLVQITLTL